ncbi:endoplasmic reticulum membrane-associated oxidoreductin (ERO1) [Vairimorpha necatrix]|uniref:Endoplasmic reticulum membrane-associated oxidoreductin (ERO1) n=1 Tax=Vairimorpha necatrix TaxID=6039 RepID=A0AAX4J921_9MICR
MLPIKLISLFLINKLSDEISILENLKISKIKLSLIPCHTKKCTLFSCKKLILKNNILNLKNLEEGKTNCKNGALIWRNIYNLSNNNIKQLVSGIHFLISRTKERQERESRGTVTNKKQFIRSILEYYFITGRVSPGYHSLNSSASILSTSYKKINHSEVNKKKVKLSYTVIGTDMKIETELNIIEDIYSFDMCEWLETFEKISLRNKWNSEQYELILRDLISDKSIDDKVFKGELSKITERILSRVYGIDRAEEWIDKLSSARQENFESISEYYEYINSYIKYYSIAHKISREEYNRKLWECFKKGLGSKTKRILIESLDVHNLDAYMKKLKTMEEEILKLRNNNMDMRKHETATKNFRNNNFPLQKKWCKFHKHNGHNSVDCFLNNGKRNDYDKNFPRRSEMNIMEEEKDSVREIIVRAKIKEHNIKVLLDSGASRSFISESLAKKLNLPLRENKAIRTVIANGEVITSNKSTEFEIKFEGVNKNYTIKPYIFDKCMHDIILGGDFLFGNNCILDYKNKVVMCDNKLIKFIEYKEIEEKTLDKAMIERICIVEDKKIEKEDKIKVKNYTAKTKDINIKYIRNKQKNERNKTFGKGSWIKNNKIMEVVGECNAVKTTNKKLKEQFDTVVKYRDKSTDIRFNDPFRKKGNTNITDRSRKKKSRIKTYKQENEVEDLVFLRKFSTNKLDKKFVRENKMCKKGKNGLWYKVHGLGFPGIPHYYNLIFFKYHNIYVYLKSRKFFKNFMLLFIFIRNRMKSLFVNKQTDQKNIEIIENIIKEIGCLDCEKCQILGSLYFYGLLGSIRNKDLNDKIYTILLYKKILSTFKMVNFLENLIK